MSWNPLAWLNNTRILGKKNYNIKTLHLFGSDVWLLDSTLEKIGMRAGSRCMLIAKLPSTPSAHRLTQPLYRETKLMWLLKASFIKYVCQFGKGLSRPKFKIYKAQYNPLRKIWKFKNAIHSSCVIHIPNTISFTLCRKFAATESQRLRRAMHSSLCALHIHLLLFFLQWKWQK